MKKIKSVLLASILAFGVLSVPAYASEHTLDEVINNKEATVTQDTTANDNNAVQETQTTTNRNHEFNGIGDTFGIATNGNITNQNQVDNIKNATDLSSESPAATKINSGISKILSIIVQVIAYAVTALLVLRVLLDLAYIAIPFARTFLSNGYSGNAQAAGGGMANQPAGMGMQGGLGMNSFNSGMNSFNSGMNSFNSGIGGMAGQGGPSPATGHVQWVSNAALNAVAAEGVVGPNGKAVSAFKVYAKNMIAVLVLAPAFLVLAVTGCLTQFGIFAGELIAKGIRSIGSML